MIKAYFIDKLKRDSQWVVSILFVDDVVGIKQIKDYNVGVLSDFAIERIAYNESLNLVKAEESKDNFSYTKDSEINLHPNVSPVPEPDSKEDLLLRFNTARNKAAVYRQLIIENFPIDVALLDEQEAIYLKLYNPEYVGLNK